MAPPKKIYSNPPRGSANTLHLDNGLPASTPQEPSWVPKATFVSSRLSDVICLPALSAFSKRQRGEGARVAPWITIQGLVTGLLPDGDSNERLATEIANAPAPVPPPIVIIAFPVGVAFAVVASADTTIANLGNTAGLIAHPLRPSTGAASVIAALFRISKADAMAEIWVEPMRLARKPVALGEAARRVGTLTDARVMLIGGRRER
jgi:hypothetical protein